MKPLQVNRLKDTLNDDVVSKDLIIHSCTCVQVIY